MPAQLDANLNLQRRAKQVAAVVVYDCAAAAHGKPVPRFALMIDTSPALMLPFAFTSDRKFVASTVWPRRPFVCATSAAFTVPFAFASPIKMLIGIVTFVDPFTLLSVTLMV